MVSSGFFKLCTKAKIPDLSTMLPSLTFPVSLNEHREVELVPALLSSIVFAVGRPGSGDRKRNLDTNLAKTP